MVKPVVGGWYMIGPHVDGLYSREKIIRILDDGVVIASMGDYHYHKYKPEEVIREANPRYSKWWYTKKEVYGNENQVRETH